MTAYRDPPTADRRHPIFELSDALDEATDEFGAAIDIEAEAEVAYKRAFAIAFVRNDDVAATIRGKLTDAAVVDEDCDLTFARAKTKRCRAKVESVQSQLSAHQTYMRYEGAVT